MSAALLIDILLWGSVAAVGLIALQRGRLVATTSLREGTMDFINIVPRIALGVIGSGYIAAVIPQEIITGWLGPDSGWLGVLTAVIAGAATPGGPFTVYPVASALLTVGADFGATLAMVVSWTLIGYGRAVAWELPIMGTDFTLWRIVISLPLPVLAGALGRFVYVRMYPRDEQT